MSTKKDPSEIIAEFFNTASPEEIKELKNIIRQRRKSSGLNNLDLSSIAQQMASIIKKQMGLSTDFVKETAEKMIRQIIRAHAPDIPEKDMNALVKAMTPSMPKKYESSVPPDMIKEMVSMFIDYSLGRMSEDEKKEMPEGWTNKYRFSFPIMIQGLINKFLNGNIDEELFWLTIDEAIRRMGEPGQ